MGSATVSGWPHTPSHQAMAFCAAAESGKGVKQGLHFPAELFGFEMGF